MTTDREALLELIRKQPPMSSERFWQQVEKALAAQSSAVLSDPYLEARAKKATGEGWKVLDRAPDVPPQAGDELPG